MARLVSIAFWLLQSVFWSEEGQGEIGCASYQLFVDAGAGGDSGGDGGLGGADRSRCNGHRSSMASRNASSAPRTLGVVKRTMSRKSVARRYWSRASRCAKMIEWMMGIVRSRCVVEGT
ncbi:hypothetical protein DFJ73DRAFT_874096 [Zopfochytrium polystomum]|nr:hypothetical protein DFJ73DRAFT_874096 [Zopfochytrium polystomum]